MFWVIKVLTTGMGEAAADGLAKVNIFMAGLVGLVGFAVAMRWQFRKRFYVIGVYWFAVAMVAVFGTMVADGLHVVYHVPYAASTALCALALVFVLRRWYRREGTLSIHSIVTHRRERYYWLTVLATFALGTAAGDLVATTLKLGFLGASVLFAVAITIPWIAWRWFGLNEVAAFWSAYVITRPLGASVADWFGKPHSFGHGLGFGDGRVAAVLTVMIVVLVVIAARRRGDIQSFAVPARPGGQSRLLYHFTSHAGLAAAVAAQRLEPAPARLGEARAVPSVIWLTDAADPSLAGEHGFESRGNDDESNIAVRVTIAVPDALPWPTWARIHRIPRHVQRRVDEAALGLGARRWVATSPIDSSDWIRITDLTGESADAPA